MERRPGSFLAGSGPPHAVNVCSCNVCRFTDKAASPFAPFREPQPRSNSDMSRFIQSLESRTLLSATLTKEMVLADQMGAIADVATTRASFKAVASGIAADTRTIAADLKS